MERHTWHRAAAGLFLACLLGVTTVGVADTSIPGDQLAPREEDRAAAIARKNTGGRVLDVRLMDEDDSSRAYAVRLLLDPGRVRTVVVDTDSEQLR